MKTRALIITIGGSLALLAPAAHAGGGSKALSCSSTANRASATGVIRKPFFSPENPRGLQSVALEQAYPDFSPMRGVTTHPVRTTGGAMKRTASVAANHYQVARNSL